MSTKFLFPDWENEDDDSQDLCGRMREMAEEAARRERQGLPEKKEPEPPAPTAKSPRKRANFFSDLVEQIAKAKILLFTEDGEPFAYDEELGCYQPIPQLLPGNHDPESFGERSPRNCPAPDLAGRPPVLPR